jgi:hypothetical protein
MKYLYRKDDGERFAKQSDGKYTMDNSQMHIPYRYSYAVLKSHGFVDSPDECVIVNCEQHYNGHGDIEDESC